MADVEKTIDIQIKADLREMLKQLKTMPDMAGDEAKKMVNQLKRQFQRAEIAAKAQAKAYAKANQQMANTTKQATQKMVASYDKVEKKSKSVRTQSRELGASLGSLEDVVSVVAPELGTLAVVAGTLGQGFRTLSRAIMTGNPVIVTLIGLTAAAATGYHLLTAATREAERRQNLMKKATEQNNEQLAEQAGIIRNLNKTMSASSRALLVQTGQITQLEADIANAKDESAAAMEKDVIAQNKYVAEQKSLLKLAKTMRSNHHALSTEEKERLEAAMMLTGQRKFQMGFAKDETALYGQMGKLQDFLTNKINEQQALANGIRDAHAKDLENRIQFLKNEEDLRAEQESADRAEQAASERQARLQAQRVKQEKQAAEERLKAAKAEQEAEKLLQKIRRSGDKASDAAQKQVIKNRRDEINLLESDVEKIKQTETLENNLAKQRIQSLEAAKQQNMEAVNDAESLFEAQNANLELDRQIAAEKEAMHINEMKFAKQRMEALEKENRARLETVKSVVTGGVEGANAVATIIKNVGGESHKAAVAAFRVQQAASLANIVMLTAEKIMAVAPNPLAMTAVGALGGVQAAAVLSQSPPEKHMGGMITKGEDTRNVTVLTGEAVLDRMTVQRLGGEQGINRLQRGIGQSPQVVVMNPFKHFDRYANASVRRGGTLASIADKKASGGY